MRITHGVLLLLCALAAACSKPPAETSSAPAEIRFEPLGHNFGDVELGSSAKHSFKLSPEPATDWEQDWVHKVFTDCEAMTVELPYLPGEVSRMCRNDMGGVTYGTECAQGLIPVQEKTYTFDVVFTPPSANAWDCRVLIDFHHLGIVALPVNGVGKRPPLAIAVAPPVGLNLGSVNADVPGTPRTVTITNIGSNAHSVGISLVQSDTAFAIVGGMQSPATIPSLSDLRLPIQCTPPGPGLFAADLVLTHQDPKKPSPIVLELKCTGLDSQIVPSDTIVAFETTRVGQPVDKRVTIRNTGNVIDHLVGIELATPHPTVGFISKPAMPFTLAASSGTTATIDLRFAPIGRMDSESDLGTLVLTFANEQPLHLPISGEATLALPASNPPTVLFGQVCIGHTESMPITVLSNGNAGFEVQRIIQPISKSFSLMPQSTLPAFAEKDREGGVALVATVTPQYETKSTSTAIVVTDAPTLATQNLVVKMEVQGMPAGISARPKKILFEAREVGAGSYRKTVTLTNCEPTPVTLLSASFEGEDGESFNLVDELAEVTLPPKATFEIDVQAIPRRGGEIQGKLALETSGGTAYVDLDATGLAPPIVPATPRDTYYSCEIGHGGESWLVAVVLVVILRRRRRVV